jgi:chromosome segregation ATPase
MMKRFFLFSLLILMFSANQLESQVKPLSKEKQKKELRKKKEKQIQKQRKAEEGLKKRHLNIQDKATRKRIKAAKKKSDKLNRSKRRKR